MSAQSPAKVTNARKDAKRAKADALAKADAPPKPATAAKAAKGAKSAKSAKLADGTSPATKATKTTTAKAAKAAKATANPGKRAPQRAKRLGEEGPVDLEAFARNKDTKKLKRRAEKPETWQLRLYVAGKTPKSIEAFRNLQQICEEHLKGRYQIEVIDLLTNPTLARGDQILALPTVVRQLPPPVKKVIGNFTTTERVLVGLDIRPLSTPARASSPTGKVT